MPSSHPRRPIEVLPASAFGHRLPSSLGSFLCSQPATTDDIFRSDSCFSLDLPKKYQEILLPPPKKKRFQQISHFGKTSKKTVGKSARFCNSLFRIIPPHSATVATMPLGPTHTCPNLLSAAEPMTDIGFTVKQVASLFEHERIFTKSSAAQMAFLAINMVRPANSSRSTLKASK